MILSNEKLKMIERLSINNKQLLLIDYYKPKFLDKIYVLHFKSVGLETKKSNEGSCKNMIDKPYPGMVSIPLYGSNSVNDTIIKKSKQQLDEISSESVSVKDTHNQSTTTTTQSFLLASSDNINIKSLQEKFYQSLSYNQVLNIYYDSEFIYKNGKQHMLSYQFGININNEQHYFIYLFEKDIQRDYLYRLENILKELISYIDKNIFSLNDFKTRLKNGKDCKTLDIQIISHYSKADITNFRNEYSKEINKYQLFRNLLNNMIEINGSFITKQPVLYYINDLKSMFKYKINLSIRDTILLMNSKNGKSLKALGEYVENDKLKVENIENMKESLEKDFEKTIKYMLNDVMILNDYIEKDFSQNQILPLTSTQEAEYISREIIKQLNNWTNEEYDYYFRGLKLVKSVKFDEHTNKAKYIKELQAINTDSGILHDLCAKNIKGGLNQCFSGNLIPKFSYDIDLSGAYPTFLSMLADIDYTKPFKIETYQDLIISKERLHKLDEKFIKMLIPSIENITQPTLLLVDFEYPNKENRPYIPYVSQSVEGGLVNTYSGQEELISNLTAYNIIQSGGVLTIKKIIKPNVRYDEQTYKPIMSIRNMYLYLAQERDNCKKLYGSSSIEQEKIKLIMNGIFGKFLQGARNRKSYNTITETRDVISFSKITNTYYGILITEYVRTHLCYLINLIVSNGGKVYSVTTDGFITDMSLDKINELTKDDLVVKLYKKIRKDFVGKDEYLEIKHSNEPNTLNTTTRVNLAPNVEGVIALGGLKLEEFTKSEIKNSSELRIKLIKNILSSQDPLKSSSKHAPTLQQVNEKGSQFELKEITSNLRLDYDYKRRPFNIHSIKHTIKGGELNVLQFDTIAYENINDYLLGKPIKKDTTKRVISEYEMKLIDNKLINKIDESKAQIYNDKSYIQSLLRLIKNKSELIGSHIFDLTNTQLIKLIKIAFDIDISINDCKNANRKDRKDKTLSLNLIQPYIDKINQFDIENFK